MKIAFIGDIAFIGEYTYEKNGQEKFKKIAAKLAEFDFVVGNLETPLTDIKKTFICKSMHLRANPENVELLRQLHVNAVSLGNNHICDYGIDGLKDTIKVLEREGIKYFGVNNKYLRIEKHNNKISFNGFCCFSANGAKYLKKDGVGVNALIYKNVKQSIERDKEDGYFSILSLHWGDEHTNYPNSQQIEFAHEISANEEVFIHGHHTHTMQGIERVNKSIVAYSLGNFSFDDCVSPFVKDFIIKKNEDNRQSYILVIELVNNKTIDYEVICIYDSEQGIILKDLSKKVEYISNEIKNYKNSEYRDRRLNQIVDTRKEKFAKRDLRWLISKMNYYSIGARLGTIVNKHRTKQAYKR